MLRILVPFVAVLLSSTLYAQIAVHGSVRSRLENWNWFEGAGDSTYSFSGNLFRLSISGQQSQWDWQVEFAMPLLLGLPDRAVAPAPQLQLGLGGNYYVANRSRNAIMVFPKQAFVRFKSVFGNGDSLRLGRFEFSDGAETTPKNATLAVLKRDRIAQRLLAPFGFSHVQRSFDGAQYTWNRGGLNVTALGAVPTRGVFQVDGWGDLAIPVLYGAVTGDINSKNNSGEWRLFVMYYGDTREIAKVDSRPAALRAGDLGNIRIGTFGGNYIHEVRTSAGSFDLLFWGAAQAGSWGRLDHRAWAFAAEAGWQPRGIPSVRPWLRAGYFQSSGDKDPLDSEHGTFFQMLPTPRIYARFPFFNLMNLKDAFGSLILRPHKTVTVRTDVHGLWLANRNDLWYQGGGAFQPWTFGYIGRPSAGESGLATLADASADWQATPAVLLSAYYGHAWGGGVVQKIYPAGAGADFGYLELTYRF